MAILTDVHRMKIQFMRRVLSVPAIALLSLLAACSTLDVGSAPKLEPKAQWALLPFANHTETPQAGLRAEAISENVLRANGLNNIKHYPNSLNNETLFEPMDRKQLDAALDWARTENMKYALTGSVDEWRYKVGIDGEPAVGMTLQLIDVASGNVVWAATGGKTGWSREGLSAVAQKLSRSMLSPLIAGAR
jgi:TolB-like protein